MNSTPGRLSKGNTRSTSVFLLENSLTPTCARVSPFPPSSERGIEWPFKRVCERTADRWGSLKRKASQPSRLGPLYGPAQCRNLPDLLKPNGAEIILGLGTAKRCE